MEALLAILAQLGVDKTTYILVIPFVVSYFFISRFLFKPYMRNIKYRQKNTGGSVEEAARLNVASERLAMDYQGKMKTQNEKASTLYEQLKSQGVAEEERILAAARAEANKLMEQARKQILGDIGGARETVRAQIPQLSGMIASRVLGRDIA